MAKRVIFMLPSRHRADASTGFWQNGCRCFRCNRSIYENVVSSNFYFVFRLVLIVVSFWVSGQCCGFCVADPIAHQLDCGKRLRVFDLREPKLKFFALSKCICVLLVN
jgi:hypothetical protein